MRQHPPKRGRPPRPSLKRSLRLLAGQHQQTWRSDRGYVLLTLLLMVALLSIAAATAASTIAFSIRRDREEEMIHRGAEYSRAIRRFTKKMGRYPLSIEDLENTNGLRFLRKRYKDPITGKDFKLLHMTDLQSIGVGGLTAAAVVPPAGAGDSQSAPNQSAFNQSALNQSGSAPGGFGQGNSAASLGANTPAPAVSGQQPAASPDDSGSNATTPAGDAQSSNSSEPIGGGVIVGVASVSRDKTIREFNHKNHYNDWLFFYDPAYDRGYPINGPTSLTMPTANLFPQQPGAQQPGTQQPASPQSASPQSAPASSPSNQ